MKILIAADSYMRAPYFEEGFAALAAEHEVEVFEVDPAPGFEPRSESERGLREFQGDPAELAARVGDCEALVVHGAPVTDRVLAAAPDLQILGCARGGPVNVDVEAVSARGLPLVNTPGKNAEAVADMTLAFVVMVARNYRRGMRFLEDGNQLEDNFAGSDFIGSDLRGLTLGLVGFGQVGSRVAERALAFGMEVIVHDPYVEELGEARAAGSFEGLLESADVVSLHLRATPETENLMDAAAFGRMKPGAIFVNTARENMVDEEALDAALASGALGGAALDVLRYSTERGRHPLLRHENVVITPHIGGATRQTLVRGAGMVAAEIEAHLAGRPLRNVVNRDAIAA